MDREEEEIQFLGCFGILKESWNIVSSWRRIFSQITLFFIIPLSFICLAHIQIQELHFKKIMHNEYILETSPQTRSSYDRISNLIASEWTAFILFKIGYLIFVIILALLSTSAVVYTIACIYTVKDVTLKKVMSVVPKVWKRLMMTFVWSFFIVFAFNIVCLLFSIVGLVFLDTIKIVRFVLILIFIIYVVGTVYLTMIWHLASVVSVLEESYGLKAMAKSQDLIKGKMGISIAVFFLLGLCFTGVQLMFKMLVVITYGEGIGGRIGYGILALILMPVVMLYVLVAQTVIYFVCKSYHHENIDKSSLADHLGVYLGEYVPLKTRDVQLEHFEV